MEEPFEIKDHWRQHRHDGTFKSVEKFCWKFAQLEKAAIPIDLDLYFDPVADHEIQGIDEAICSAKALEFAVYEMQRQGREGRSLVRLRTALIQECPSA